MTDLNVFQKAHPEEAELADFMAGGLSKKDRSRVEEHLGSCRECMDAMVAAKESVDHFNKERRLKNRKGSIVKKINIYLLLAIVSFSLSFITPRYFIQLLVATLLLGIKWVVDSKTTKMLVMIHEAWKQDGDKGASRVLKTLERDHSNRL